MDGFIKERMIEQALRPFMHLLSHASEKDIERLAALVDRLTFGTEDKAIMQEIRRQIREDAPGAQLMRRAFREIAPHARTRMIRNLMLNSPWGVAEARRSAFFEEEGFWPPYTVLVSPTMRCNLRCAGCSTGQQPRDSDLPMKTIDRLVAECDSMGIRVMTVLGGEPFLRKDLWDLYERNRDMIFHIYTNGTLIDKEAARRLAELGNVLLVISIDGPEADTDARRAPGVFTRILRAMDNLRGAGAMFGFSATLTSQNLERVVSDEFVNMLIDKGCLFGWHFPYMPVGRDPDFSLMPTPAQREFLRTHGAARIRAEKPLFVMDFLNDSPFVGGCIAAGRRFLHVTARGDVEPCIFAQFAVDNIREKSLREVLRSPFFTAIRAAQPHDENHLRPCMLIDHPEAFRSICAEHQPRATNPGAEALVTTLKNDLDAYSAELGGIMDEAWAERNGSMSSDSPRSS